MLDHDVPTTDGLGILPGAAGDFRSDFVREPARLKHFPSLVLNADYRPLSYYPLSLWPWQEAMKAVFLDRVNILAEYDAVVRSQRQAFRIPSVVVLKDFVKPRKKVAFTRFNLFMRDEFRCQYCGGRDHLTFDHVVPRSRGGITSWENVVAACSPCNLKKANKSLRASGMVLRKKPVAPTPEVMHAIGRRFPPGHLHESWMDYLYWDTELES
ncbi:HNH endonuclease [Paracoccus sp. p4-l81]|uniref:HNH endonuclease n=1 Tax=unclassified Paracoccus (in: a-proteobacteria) TaxID=2688777 RepID=UPI0035B6C14F